MKLSELQRNARRLRIEPLFVAYIDAAPEFGVAYADIKYFRDIEEAKQAASHLLKMALIDHPRAEVTGGVKGVVGMDDLIRPDIDGCGVHS